MSDTVIYDTFADAVEPGDFIISHPCWTRRTFSDPDLKKMSGVPLQPQDGFLVLEVLRSIYVNYVVLKILTQGRVLYTDFHSGTSFKLI